MNQLSHSSYEPCICHFSKLWYLQVLDQFYRASGLLGLKILLGNQNFSISFLSKVKHIQMIGASATVNDVLQEDLTEIGWGDHVKLIQSSTLEGQPFKVPPCIKHQYVICDESVGLTKAQALAR